MITITMTLNTDDDIMDIQEGFYGYAKLKNYEVIEICARKHD